MTEINPKIDCLIHIDAQQVEEGMDEWDSEWEILGHLDYMKGEIVWKEKP